MNGSDRDLEIVAAVAKMATEVRELRERAERAEAGNVALQREVDRLRLLLGRICAAEGPAAASGD